MKWIIEDTLTGMLSNLEQENVNWNPFLNEFANHYLLPDIEEETPEESGYLVASARKYMKIESTLDGARLSLHMTGKDNPIRHSQFKRGNTKLDYALFQHENDLGHLKAGAKWKYLSDPVEMNAYIFYDEISDELRKKVDSFKK